MFRLAWIVDVGCMQCYFSYYVMGKSHVAPLKEPHDFTLLTYKRNLAKYKMEHVNKWGSLLQGKEKVIKASGVTINASCYRNGNGSHIMGLDSHLSSNSIHWNFSIKYDSNCRKHKNDTCSWYECMQHREGITLHSVGCYI